MSSNQSIRRHILLFAIGFSLLAALSPAPAATVWIPNASTNGITDNTTNSNVGIGTATPVAKLSVSDTTTSTTNHLQISGPFSTTALHLGQFSNGAYVFNNYFYNSGQTTDNSSLGSTGILLGTTSIQFQYASASATPSRITAMMVDNSGNVGIGTTSPGYLGSLLQAQADQNATTRTIVKNDSSGSSAAAELALNASGNSWALGMGSSANNSNAFYIGKDISGGTPAAKYLSITTAGNVGIGTTSPNYTLSFGPNLGRVIALYESSGTNLYGMATGGNAAGGSDPYRTKLFANGLEAMSLTYAGNVGIGTAAPNKRLEVSDDGGGFRLSYASEPTVYNLSVNTVVTASVVRYSFDQVNANVSYLNTLVLDRGNIGIGTASPGRAGARLQAQTDQNSTTRVLVANDNSGSSSATEFVLNASGNSWALGMGSLANNSNAFYIGKDVSGGTPAAKYLSITTAGDVGIGTTNPGSYKLAVVGKIHATEVVVETGWSDYVFADDYRLAPLSEVEAHIKAEKHLPGIPSAAEVDAGGVSLGDMQAKLLAKVEELTLHAIAQEKRFVAQQKCNEALQTEVAALRAELAKLSTHP